MRKELDGLIGKIELPSDKLIAKALKYMVTLWDQLFLYVKDGRYIIDNLATERNIRLLAG